LVVVRSTMQSTDLVIQLALEPVKGRAEAWIQRVRKRVRKIERQATDEPVRAASRQGARCDAVEHSRQSHIAFSL